MTLHVHGILQACMVAWPSVAQHGGGPATGFNPYPYPYTPREPISAPSAPHSGALHALQLYICAPANSVSGLFSGE